MENPGMLSVILSNAATILTSIMSGVSTIGTAVLENELLRIMLGFTVAGLIGAWFIRLLANSKSMIS